MFRMSFSRMMRVSSQKSTFEYEWRNFKRIRSSLHSSNIRSRAFNLHLKIIFMYRTMTNEQYKSSCMRRKNINFLATFNKSSPNKSKISTSKSSCFFIPLDMAFFTFIKIETSWGSIVDHLNRPFLGWAIDAGFEFIGFWNSECYSQIINFESNWILRSQTIQKLSLIEK